jgi:lysophospholipase L1-like esterase
MSVLSAKNEKTGEWEDIPCIQGAQGETGATGPQGEPGIDGYTPVKGVDYYTDAEKAEFENLITQEMAKKAQLKPEFANSVAECTDTTKVYVLPDGYIYGYMTKTVTHVPVNQIKESTDTDSTPYNGGLGYKTNTALGASGEDVGEDVSGVSGIETTGYIRCAYGDIIRSKNIPFSTGSGYRRLAFYDASFTNLKVYMFGSQWQPLEQFLVGDDLYFDTTATAETSDMTAEQKQSIAYIRICAGVIDANSIVTVNEDTENTTETVTGWMNTEIPFTSSDYEDRIAALEERVIPKSRHHGKVCVCFGDSIVGNMPAPNDYPTVLGEETGMTVYNAGFGGCRMSASMDTVYNAYSMVKLADAITTGDWTEQENGLASVGNYYLTSYEPHIDALKNMDWSKVDFITVGYGTNDIANFVPVDNEEDPMDTTTLLGGLRYALTALLTAYPHLKVLILTPIYRYFNAEGVDSDEKEWYNDREFTTWTDGILDVAKELRVPAVDMYRTLCFNKYTRSHYFSEDDGTHPNEEGLKVMAEKIAGKLLSEY